MLYIKLILSKFFFNILPRIFIYSFFYLSYYLFNIIT
nr:MAG TPA: hypothetical protein [Caudoviricetes sp.]